MSTKTSWTIWILRLAASSLPLGTVSQSPINAVYSCCILYVGVGYFNQQSDKLNTYQVVLISDGRSSYAEFLYPQDGLQWIQVRLAEFNGTFGQSRDFRALGMSRDCQMHAPKSVFCRPMAKCTLCLEAPLSK